MERRDFLFFCRGGEVLAALFRYFCRCCLSVCGGTKLPFQSFEQYVLNVPTRFPSLKLHYVQCTYYVLYVVVAVPMLAIPSVQFSSEQGCGVDRVFIGVDSVQFSSVYFVNTKYT